MSLEEDLSRIYGCKVEIGNTYESKDGRRRTSLKIDGKYTVRQYGKLLLEQKLGRRLNKVETVDHIDEDKTNDDPDNLQPLTRSENARKSSLLRQSHLYFPEITDDERENRRIRAIGENNNNSVIPDELVVRFRKLVGNGDISCNELADHFYLDRKTMRNLLTGISFSHLGGALTDLPTKTRISEEIISEIKYLRSLNLSAREIGRRLNIDHSTVTKYW